VALKGAFKLQLINSRLDNSELANHLIETKRKFLFDIKMKTTICLFLAATCIAVTLASPGHRHHGRPRLQPARPSKDLVDTAVGAGSFNTLVKLVQDLGLEQTLRNARGVTVFAPTDDAFAKLPAGTLESLSTEQAKEIVLTHVVGAKVPAAAVMNGAVATLSGKKITLQKSGSGVSVKYNGGVSNVIKADVFATNGVIHVIDKVIV